MPTQTMKPFRRVGVGDQYICFHGEPAQNGSLTFEEDVFKLETVASIETTEERSSERVYASNKIYDTDVSVDPPMISVENAAFPALVLARMRGNTVQGGFVKHSTFDEGASFAHGVVFPKKGGQLQFVWYPYCKMASNTDAAQTKDASGPNSQNRTVEIQAYPFNDAGDYKIEYDYELLATGATPVTEAAFFAAPLLDMQIPSGGD